MVGGVAADDLGAGEVAATAAVDGEDVVASSDELFDEGLADLAGSEDDVAAHEGLFAVLVAADVEEEREDCGEQGDGHRAGRAEDGELLARPGYRSRC